MHAVRPAADGAGHGCVARRAFGNGAGMALHVDAQHIVVGVRAGVFGVRGTVARLALQATMAGAEAVQVEAAGRGVDAGGKAGIAPDFGQACAINAVEFALAVMVA